MRRITAVMAMVVVGAAVCSSPAWAEGELLEAFMTDLRFVANQKRFVAAIAWRCDWDLQVWGKAGLHKDDCADFRQRFGPLNTIWLALIKPWQPQLDALLQTAPDQTLNTVNQLTAQIQAADPIIQRTLDHLQFWSAPSADATVAKKAAKPRP